ncbi:MAG: sortase [Chloroflexi bacterium]|nr:sortase [Chloroflexota bacterium]
MGEGKQVASRSNKARGAGRRGKRLLRMVGALLTVVGGAVLLAVAGYYIYSFYAESQLNQYNQSAAAPLDRAAAIKATATPVATTIVSTPQGPTKPGASASPAATPVPTVEVTLKPLVTPTATPRPQPLAPKRITIPSINVDARIIPVTTIYEDGKPVWATASHAVGHHEGSANPGEPDNIIMSGHISSPLKGEGSVFKRLPQLKLEAEVVLYTEKKVYRYRVVETKVIKPEQIEVMNPTPYPILTLITCVPDWVYSHRLIVLAEPVSEEDNIDEPPLDDDPKKHP